MGDELVVLTGATGFIGRNVLPALLERGHRVRAVSRRGLGASSPRHACFEEVRADLGDAAGLERALKGATSAYYLVHSMEGGVEARGEFVAREQAMARAFGEAAGRAGVRHIVYLGGLQSVDEQDVSDHLRSRREVERGLGSGGVPVTTLRAGFIIGPGSAAFEMLRALTDKMSLMMIPPQLKHYTQPSCIEDVVEALVRCIEEPEAVSGATLDVGSAERLSYFDIVKLYCAASGRTTKFLEVPWAPRSLSAVWVAAVSGLSYTLAHALSEGMEVDLPLTTEALYERLPGLTRTPPQVAMRRAVAALATPSPA
jgi:uncharacterized protein YbjT (DUF2867 family)